MAVHGWCRGGQGGAGVGGSVGRVGGGLVPDAQEGVPGARGDRHAVLGDAQAGHAVVVAGEDACGENICFSLKTTTME